MKHLLGGLLMAVGVLMIVGFIYAVVKVASAPQTYSFRWGTVPLLLGFVLARSGHKAWTASE